MAKNQKSKGSSKSKNTEKPTATKGISLKGKQVVLQSTIVFDGDSADLNPKSLNALEAIKTFLASNPSTKLTMEVHTHLVQDADTSMALSQDRGKRLINELKALGVASQKIKLKPMGASKNTVPNVSQKGRTQNQKVLFYWQ